jgi:hypothetical protein
MLVAVAALIGQNTPLIKIAATGRATLRYRKGYR